METINATILLRSQTAAEWDAENPVLGEGEAGVVPGSGIIKIGDGKTRWRSLPEVNDERLSSLETKINAASGGNTSGNTSGNSAAAADGLYLNDVNTAIGKINNVAAKMTANPSRNNVTILGSQSTTETKAYSNVTAVGACSYQHITGNNQVRLGNTNAKVYVGGATTELSDGRDKADVQGTELGLDFINLLRPVDYRWDNRKDYYDEVETENGKKWVYKERDGSKKRKRFHHGFIAQDVERLIEEGAIPGFGGFDDNKIDGGEDVLGLGYTEFIAPMVKAIQELSAKVASLENKLKERGKK